MRTYKNYDVSENDLQEFLAEISELQAEIKGSSLIYHGLWRLLLWVDSSDESVLDRKLIMLRSDNDPAKSYEMSLQHAHNE